MRYIMGLILSVLLVSMLNYVVSSILGVSFDFNTGLYISIIFAVLVFMVGAIIPNESTPDKEDHAH